MNLKERIRSKAGEAGFDAMRVANPDDDWPAAENLQSFLARGYHGDMGWMKDTAGRRRSPRGLWPGVQSVIMLGMNYGPESDPLDALAMKDRGVISVYARGGDYHSLVKKRLRRVAGWLYRETGFEVKIFVDTAPVMEKPLAEAAGLGWQGKHTNLVSTEFGSWLFLGSIFTTAPLAADETHDDRCGSCRRCLDVCPTDAFPAPYQLDARKCISYLTIEHRGHIALEFRRAMGNRIFGCDDCLAVCPWNKYARRAQEVRLHARAGADNPPLGELLRLDDVGFRERFKGSAIKRTGHARFLRNVLIAAGNSGDPGLLKSVLKHLASASPLVRAMAVWALGRLCNTDELDDWKKRCMPIETDTAVLAEWKRCALNEHG